ncbi:MAG: hypothetical protein COB48_00335 [Pseudoalteromonas sp.]|nr:MAG: hypothetical protein COB48_00335 [Pseudoalteromonas sp.]
MRAHGMKPKRNVVGVAVPALVIRDVQQSLHVQIHPKADFWRLSLVDIMLAPISLRFCGLEDLRLALQTQ